MRERILFWVLVVVLAFSMGCAGEITKNHARFAFGQSTITDEEVSGGSLSDGTTEVAGDVVDAAVKAASMLPGVSNPPPESITVVVEDERDTDEE